MATLRSPGRSDSNIKQRGRTACTRCKTRKQKCDGTFPICSTCSKANVECDLSIIRHDEATIAKYVRALENKVAELEVQLEHVQQLQQGSPCPVAGSGHENQTSIGAVLELLARPPFGSFLPGSASRSPQATTNLEDIVQASVWNRALAQPGDGESHVDGRLGRRPVLPSVRPGARQTTNARPPGDAEGRELIDAYVLSLDTRYPFLDREEIIRLHTQREVLSSSNPQLLEQNQRFGLFKLYLVYAIGAGLLVSTKQDDHASSEAFYMSALQHITAAREARSLENVEAMALLVIFHLRSAVNQGLWYMIGLAMLTCIDLGLHRSGGEVGLEEKTVQQRRKLFWTVRSLERNISVFFGYPSILSDRHISVDLPTIEDNNVKLQIAVQLFSLRRIESRIHHSIYHAERPVESMLGKLGRYFDQLQAWKDGLMLLTINTNADGEFEYQMLQYHRAMRLLVHPFLSLLPNTNPYLKACLESVGQICQIRKRLHQNRQHGHSFIAVQTVFEAGIIMLYCLWTRSHEVWSIQLSNDIRACTAMLFVMSERAPWVAKYRDAFETLVNATMDSLQVNDRPNTSGTIASDQVIENNWTYMPPPLQVVHDRWMDFDGAAVAGELANWVNQDVDAATAMWTRDSEIYRNI